MGTNQERAREALKGLSIPEKLRIVQDLWDEIARSRQEITHTSDQREDPGRRRRAGEADFENTKTWEEMRRELEGPH